MESFYVRLNALFENPQFAKEFEANPVEAYEKHSGEKWPFEQVNVKVVADDANTLHITFPKPPGILYDDELASVSGGMQLDDFSDAASAGSASTFGCFIGCLGTAGTASSNSARRVVQAVGQIMHGEPEAPDPSAGTTRPPTE